ncbi:hypothetical protein SDC9_130326 [bioreactor metagenome]|uniref:Uncharacterized protein n=1 Tax=bioreactor metagenome TaxID=1076179 RepID=A0A645D2C1_9ZZZZ
MCEPLFNKTTRYWRTTPPAKPSRIAKALQSAAEKLPAKKKAGETGDVVFDGGGEGPQTENGPASRDAALGSSGAEETPEKEPAQTH